MTKMTDEKTSTYKTRWSDHRSGCFLTQLSACSSDDSDDNDRRPPTRFDDLGDLGYQGDAPFIQGNSSGDPLHERLRLAEVCCANYSFGYFNGYADIAKRAYISAVIHLGGYIYEYPEGFYSNPTRIKERPIDPKTEIISLEE